MSPDVPNWVRDELNNRASKEWVEARLSDLERRSDDTKKLAIKAREKASEHECAQEATIDELRASVNGWSVWFRRGAISFVGFLLFIASGWLYQFFTLRQSVADTQASIQVVENKVNELQSNQVAFEKKLGSVQADQSRQDTEQLEEIKAVIRKEFANSKVRASNR